MLCLLMCMEKGLAENLTVRKLPGRPGHGLLAAQVMWVVTPQACSFASERSSLLSNPVHCSCASCHCIFETPQWSSPDISERHLSRRLPCDPRPALLYPPSFIPFSVPPEFQRLKRSRTLSFLQVCFSVEILLPGVASVWLQ